jgi:hypothetical protein
MPPAAGDPQALAARRRILGVVLGATRFPHLPSVDSLKLRPVFARSKTDLTKYLKQICVEILDCFDSMLLPNKLCLRIANFLEARRSLAHSLCTDLIIYYVGDGGFLNNQEYYLACRATRENQKHATGLRVADLAATVTQSFRNRRIYLVIDCCFAGSAVESFQAASDDLIGRQSERLPIGIAMLNASSRDQVAVVPEGGTRTMFSDCLVEVLHDGIAEAGQFLSLREIGKAVTDKIYSKYPLEAVRPEVHSPRQSHGDVAHFKLFPNPGYVESQVRETRNSITAMEVAKIYNFPPSLDGSGQCIGIIHVGSLYAPEDVKTYCSNLGLEIPSVTVRPVLGARKIRKTDYLSGLLTTLVEICCGVAPATRLTIYLASTFEGFMSAIETANVDERNSPSVLVVAWGAPESNWPRGVVRRIDRALIAACLRGITVCCAAGDGGTTLGLNDDSAHVYFPASSPHVLACGGTSLKVIGSSRADEVAWTSGGGGFSDVFSTPEWQTAAIAAWSSESGVKTGRGVPDVSAHADPALGYRVFVDGHWRIMGGTTASTVVWAALIALLNQCTNDRIAFNTHLLYNYYGPAGALNDITKGISKASGLAYTAGLGWDPCTGWGTPDGNRLLLAAKLFSQFRARQAQASGVSGG